MVIMMSFEVSNMYTIKINDKNNGKGGKGTMKFERSKYIQEMVTYKFALEPNVML